MQPETRNVMSVSTAEYQKAWRARNGANTGKPGRPEKPAPPCGTVPAYRRHVRRGEAIDDSCHAAWAEYHRQRRNRTTE